MKNLTLLTLLLPIAFAFACSADTGSNSNPTNRAQTNQAAAATQTTPAVGSNSADSAAADSLADADNDLAGRWTGPEGTYLNIVGSGEEYEIEIKDLDGTNTYKGRLENGLIEFTRDGETEMIRPVSGEATGMKWLSDKKNCVVIRKGSEGYCKD